MISSHGSADRTNSRITAEGFSCFSTCTEHPKEFTGHKNMKGNADKELKT